MRLSVSPCSWLLVGLIAGLPLACENHPPAPPPAPQVILSPKDSPVSYQVLKDELNNGTVEFHVLAAGNVKHDDMDKLLVFLYRHLMTRHEDPPSGAAGYVYGTLEAFKTPPRTPLGSFIKHPSDLGATYENKVPFEFWQEIERALGERHDQGWKLAMKVERDDAKKSLKLLVPYTEPGIDRWADKLSFNQAIQVFTDLAQALFNNVRELSTLTFSGVWKDKEILHVELTRDDFSALKLNELDDRIGQHHGRAFLELAGGKGSDDKVAKGIATRVAKEYRAMLTQLKGKATVASVLK